MFWGTTNRPNPPPVEQERQFVEWLLRYGTDFAIYRQIYKRDIDTYVRLNSDAVMKELESCATAESLSTRLGVISLLYVNDFMPIVEAKGGLLLCDPKLQACASMIQIKVQAMHYILKYKYRDTSTIAAESYVGPLEDIYSA